jgi:DNA polymerase-1
MRGEAGQPTPHAAFRMRKRPEEKRGGTVLIASGDRDTFQLASDRTTILYPVRAGERARVGPAEVRMRYGVEPG